MASIVCRHPRRSRVGAVLAAVALTASGCGAAAAAGPAAAPGATAGAMITAVGAENEYADVISQIGGRYVTVTAVETNPNTDPHTFEASPSIAKVVSAADVVVENGVGYDTFIDRIVSASSSATQRVISAQKLLGLPDSTPNPHLWYDPRTMPAVAGALAADFAALQPTHAAYFRANARTFDASLQPWLAALASFRATFPNTPVATTEPVADDMLEAAGTRDLTPPGLQSAIMDGVDPAPQDISTQTSLFDQRTVKVFLYNQQVTDTLTETFRSAAARNHIPVVGVYETMPTPGYHYQSWMLAEVEALRRAVADGTSTENLS